MIVYDDLEASEKIKIYDKGVTVTSRPESMYKLMIGYRTGDMHAPQLEVTEALRLEAQHFADCIETGAQPLTDGYSGLRVVQMLEAATASMRRQGAPAVVETEELRAAAFVA
jgi:predicted dehydrogenase